MLFFHASLWWFFFLSIVTLLYRVFISNDDYSIAKATKHAYLSKGTKRTRKLILIVWVRNDMCECANVLYVPKAVQKRPFLHIFKDMSFCIGYHPMGNNWIDIMRKINFWVEISPAGLGSAHLWSTWRKALLKNRIIWISSLFFFFHPFLHPVTW